MSFFSGLAIALGIYYGLKEIAEAIRSKGQTHDHT